MIDVSKEPKYASELIPLSNCGKANIDLISSFTFL